LHFQLIANETWASGFYLRTRHQGFQPDREYQHVWNPYRIEKQARGTSAGDRLALRQAKSAPKIATFKAWLDHARAQVSAKSPTGDALKYIAKYWDGLILFLTDGRIEMDSNAVERTIRPIALQRKNALFAGDDAGAPNWAMLASLIETCKLNKIEPHSYITGVLSAIVNGHKQKDNEQLLPWKFRGWSSAYRDNVEKSGDLDLQQPGNGAH
jgi:transposase